MEEAPPVETPVVAVAEFAAAPEIDARDHLVTECLRAVHASRPRLPRSTNLSGWLSLNTEQLEGFVRCIIIIGTALVCHGAPVGSAPP